MFHVGDIVRKKTGTQKYKVLEVVGDECKVTFEPKTNPDVILTFKSDDLVLVS